MFLTVIHLFSQTISVHFQKIKIKIKQNKELLAVLNHNTKGIILNPNQVMGESYKTKQNC